MGTANAEDLRRQLGSLYDPVREDLQHVDRILAERLQSPIPFLEELISRVRLYQGKRIRPTLLLLSAQACGEVRQEHHVLGAVIEMIHAASLVHDDVLDDANTRRHVTTVNAEWGVEASVLLGDYLFTQAYHLAASLDTPLGCRMIGDATNQTCEGELHQVARRGLFELSEEEYIEIIAGKTAELIACSCRVGAFFAGASEEAVEALAGYGRDLGIAFQIADDVLDLIGNPETTGKSIGTDLTKQKVTLPLIRFRQTAPEQDVERIRSYFEDPTRNHRRELIECLSKSDAIDYSQGKARQLANDAKARLSILPDSPARSRLIDAASVISDRAY